MANLLKVMLGGVLTQNAAAWFMDATVVDGGVVGQTGGITGGKIGTYKMLLQDENPGLGDMKLVLECCGLERHRAVDVATQINTNAYGGHVEAVKEIREQHVGEGKCSAPGPEEAMSRRGNPMCTYLYAFADKSWKDYQYTAQCVASDVCAVDVVGATKGFKGTYPVVIQILNRNAGDMQYAGLGPIGSCLEGMNLVNTAGNFTHKEPSYIELFGRKIPTGQKSVMHFDGMKRLGIKEMFTKCENRSDTGMLYVFKNKFWINADHDMNITHFDIEEDKIKRKKELEEMKQKIENLKKGNVSKPASKPEGMEAAKDIGKVAEQMQKTNDNMGDEDVEEQLAEAEEKIEEKQMEEEAEQTAEEEQAKADLNTERDEYQEYQVKKQVHEGVAAVLGEAAGKAPKVPGPSIPLAPKFSEEQTEQLEKEHQKYVAWQAELKEKAAAKKAELEEKAKAATAQVSRRRLEETEHIMV